MTYICSLYIKYFPWNTADENWLISSSIKLVLLLEQIIKALIFLYFFLEVGPHVVSLKFPPTIYVYFSWVATEGASPTFYHSNSNIFLRAFFSGPVLQESLQTRDSDNWRRGNSLREALHQRPTTSPSVGESISKHLLNKLPPKHKMYGFYFNFIWATAYTEIRSMGYFATWGR